jgi:hypothetical protein
MLNSHEFSYVQEARLFLQSPASAAHTIIVLSRIIKSPASKVDAGL